MILKTFSVVIVGFTATVFGGFIGFLGDIGPHEGPLERAIFLWVIYSLGGIYVGLILPRFWGLAVLVALPSLMSIVPMFNSVNGMRGYNDTAWWIAVNTTIIAPMFALASGCIGSRIHRNYTQKATPRSKVKTFFWYILHTVPLLLCFSFYLLFFFQEQKGGYVGIGDPPYMMASPSPLHQAAEQGDLEKITRLIEQGDDINGRDSAGRTALHYAVGEEQIASVELLLANGADPDIADNEYRVTPLHWAVGSGNLEIVKLLASRMRNIDAKNKENRTAAGIAYSNGNLEIARLLVTHGAVLSESLD